MTKLEKYMQDKNWTSPELAKKLGRSKNSVDRFMKVGLTKHDISTKYARAMGCNVTDIKED